MKSLKNFLKKFTFKRVGITLVVIFVVMQAFRIDKTNPPIDQTKDFIEVNKPSPEIASLIKSGCYDCHSNETVYPWYTNVAPVSWWIKDHINEARRHLNFNNWTTYNSKKQDKKLRECVENINEGDMPMDSYTWMHKLSDLTKVQQKVLTDYFNSLRTHESGEGKPKK
jgi:hypothetical protein